MYLGVATMYLSKLYNKHSFNLSFIKKLSLTINLMRNKKTTTHKSQKKSCHTEYHKI